MKDIIRMNQLAGLITENQARKMMAVILNEESYSPTTPKQGILYTPKHKYGSWAKSTNGVEGSYAIEK
jgi:hypothetical protein